MAYTTKQAVETFKYYLGTAVTNKYVISDTKDRGFVIELPNAEKAVVFIYPLVHKQDNTKNYFDTRDSGAYERSVAWRYARNNDLKYFCLGINDQVDKYNEYIFSLECDEKEIERISGTKNGSRSGPGKQIIIPNDYIPSKSFERIRNKLGIFISVFHMDSLIDYLEKYDNRPYLSDVNMVEVMEENEYQRAARILNEYILESGIVYEKTEDELASILDEFRRKFAPKRLMELSDEDLLREMFYTAEQTNDSMCYWLEFQKDCRSQFGSVTGGTSLKFGLYQNKEGEWITGSPAM